MPHSAIARRAAAAMPLVLFGEYGRTVEGYMPAEEDLAIARLDLSHRAGRGIGGPHLRTARAAYVSNKTGIVGISVSRRARDGKHFLYVNLGATSRHFCIETFGSSEAWRRAIALRRAHLEKLALANAAIIAARIRNQKPEAGSQRAEDRGGQS
jgi:hypothetical protein